MIRTLLAAAVAAALVGPPGPAQADECEDLLGGMKKMIDALDPAKAEGEAKLCSSLGEGIGLLKVFRIVSDECLPTGEKRIGTLAGLDRAIRKLQAEADKKCQ
jgi:hypothetical protein